MSRSNQSIYDDKFEVLEFDYRMNLYSSEEAAQKECDRLNQSLADDGIDDQKWIVVEEEVMEVLGTFRKKEDAEKELKKFAKGFTPNIAQVYSGWTINVWGWTLLCVVSEELERESE